MVDRLATVGSRLPPHGGRLMPPWLIGFIFVMYIALLFCMWSLLAVSAEADRRAEQSFEEWKAQRDRA